MNEKGADGLSQSKESARVVFSRKKKALHGGHLEVATVHEFEGLYWRSKVTTSLDGHLVVMVFAIQFVILCKGEGGGSAVGL